MIFLREHVWHLANRHKLLLGIGMLMILLSIHIRNLPTSLIPTRPQTTVELSWDVANAESSWNVQYRVYGAADWSVKSNVTSHTAYVLSSLASGTTYEVRVQANISGALWSETTTFDTQCGIVDIDPAYIYGFETAESSKYNCWTKTNFSATTGITSNYTHGGSYKFEFMQSSTNTEQTLISPQLNTTANGVRVAFFYRQSSSGYYYYQKFKVGYSTDETNYTWDDVVTSSTNSYTLYQHDFAVEGIQYIAIQWIRNTDAGYGNLYIDDITLSESPSCVEPSGLTKGTITAHTAQLSWTKNGDEDAWDIAYSTTSGDQNVYKHVTNENVSISGTTVSYILGDNDGVTLNGETQYFVSVRANCTENSVWSNEVNFTTAVACTNISSYSWATVSGITPEGAVISWNDTDHSEWLLAYSTSSSAPGIDVTTTTGNYTVVSCENSTYTFEGLNYSTTYYVWVRANCGGIDGYSRWSTYSKSFTTLVQFPAPTIASTSATPDGAVVTWNKGYEETQWQIQLGVQEGYSWTYTLVDGILDAQTYTFTGLTEQTSYRVQVRAYIDAEHQSAWSNYGSFTTLASCPKPTNLTYSDLTANSVVLDWTIGYDETAWNIQYKANGAADWTLIENITTKPYSMTVEDATTYQVQIQNTCGSDWSNIITFTTPCLPNSTFPFEEDFEGLTADKDIPNCWNNATGNTSDSYKWGYKTGSGNGSTVTNGHNGTKCIRFESYYNSAGNYNDLKTPVMNFPAGKTMVLGFWWKNPAGGDFSVYISTDGGATYTTALKSGMTGQSGWKEEEIELTDYVGAENVVVVFKGTSNCGNGNAFIYLDDVTISEKSDCAKPKDLAVSSFDNHSATLSWDANGSVSPWQVAYSTTEYFNLDDPTAYSVEEATTNPFTLSGLTNFTTYYVRVRTKCGESTYSDWNNNGYQTFTTTATYTAPTNVAYSNVGDTEATISWTKGNNEEDNDDYTVWYKTGDTELTQDVENATSVTLTGLTAGSNYEVKVRAKKGDDFSAWSSSVEFQTAFCAIENQCEISYTLTDSWGDGWNGNSKLDVVYIASNIIVATLKLSSGSETSGTLALCNDAVYDFVWTKGTADYEDGFVFYDVNNEVIYEHVGGSSSTTPPSEGIVFTYTMDCTVATCTRPSDLTATAVHPNSAELSWTENGTDEAWQIAYSTESFDPNAANFDLATVSVEEANSNPFELEGLDNSQTYYAYVRAVCGANDNSKWSTTACEFTTQSACPAPTDVHLVSRPASNQLAIGWTAGYEETNWNFYYRVAGAEEWSEPVAVATTATYTITGELSTAYEVKVAAVCGENEGEASEVVTFSTPTNVTVAVPFNEGFNSTSCPEGWTIIKNLSTNTTWDFADNEAKTTWRADDGIYLITPLLYLDDKMPQLSFSQRKYKYGSYTGDAAISVMISTTGTAAEDFTEVWTGSTSELSTTASNKTVFLSNYVNNSVYIAFKYKTNNLASYRWYISNVAITIENAFRTAGNWDVAENWSEKVPTSEDDAIIAAAATVPSGVVATANNITVAEGGSLTITDGGQLVHNNAGVQATVQKHIEKHGENDGWYFISSSVATDVAPSLENGIIAPTAENYDLYYYDEPAHYWRNYKEGGMYSGFSIAPKKGYLYANGEENGRVLSFTGTLQPGNANVEKTLEFNTAEDAVLAGWNLVGNPFTFNVTLDMPCYTITGNAINTEPHAGGSYTVAPCEGVMVMATEENQSVTFTKASQQAPQPNQLQMTVAQQVMTRGIATSTVNDKAIVNFNAGSPLEKFVFNADAAKLYIPQNGKDYAIVSTQGQGEIPVNFKAASDGQYTLTVNPEGVEMNYLHLIDNMTGANVDLLASPSYTFTATTHDYESRFRLVFASINGDADGDNETFAFFSNDLLIVTNEGEATLQVVDMSGHILSSQTLHGTESVNVKASAGVYMLRLINGNDVRTQKIVVR